MSISNCLLNIRFVLDEERVNTPLTTSSDGFCVRFAIVLLNTLKKKNVIVEFRFAVVSRRRALVKSFERLELGKDRQLTFLHRYVVVIFQMSATVTNLRRAGRVQVAAYLGIVIAATRQFAREYSLLQRRINAARRECPHVYRGVGTGINGHARQLIWSRGWDTESNAQSWNCGHTTPFGVGEILCFGNFLHVVSLHVQL